MTRAAIAGCALSLLVALAGLASVARAADEIIIGVGAKGGTHYQTGRAICGLVNRHAEHVTCSVRIAPQVDSSDSVFNIDNVSAGALDFGVVQSDVQYRAVTKTGQYAFVDRSYDDLRSVFSVPGMLFTVVARRDAGIRTLGDLVGKRVNVGDPNSPQRALMDAVMAAHGWSEDDFDLIDELPADQQSLALCHNQVQAAVYVVGHPNQAIARLAELCDAAVVGIDGGAIDKLLGERPYLAYAAIPGGVYGNNPDDVTTIGYRATIVTTADMDGDLVRRVVEAVFANLDRLKRMHRGLGSLTPESMIGEGLAAPPHRGARDYFVEAGMM